MKTRTALVIAGAFVVFGAGKAQAAHKDVKHCANDYKKYCHQWGLETKELETAVPQTGLPRLEALCG